MTNQEARGFITAREIIEIFLINLFRTVKIEPHKESALRILCQFVPYGVRQNLFPLVKPTITFGQVFKYVFSLDDIDKNRRE